MNQHDCRICGRGSIHELIREITDILSRGLEISDAVRDFALTATGRDVDMDLAADLLDNADSELEMVLDLIFFPDESVRSRIEPLIPEDFEKSDEEKLVESIIGQRPVCTIQLNGQPSTFGFNPDKTYIERFIRRLNLSFTFPARISALLDRRFGPEKSAAKLIIRTMNPDGKELGLVEDFLLRIGDVFPPEPDDLKTVILISGMFPEGKEIMQILGLAIEKWDYILKKIEDFEAAMSSGCMEELMARGMRPPSASRASVEKKLADARKIIDLLGFNPENHQIMQRYTATLPVSVSYRSGL